MIRSLSIEPSNSPCVSPKTNPAFKMYKLSVFVAFAALFAVASAIGLYDNGLGYGAYSLYNGGVTYGIGSYGGHGIHGHGGYRGGIPYAPYGAYGYGGYIG